MAHKPTITFTFIRHGESTDNLRDVWAGWKDSPLSNHGMSCSQAKALGASLANIRFTAIYASPLKRALWTAQAVQDAQSEPKPPLNTSLLLREQYWGIAEGKKWTMEPWIQGLSLEDHCARGLFPVIPNRTQKFPEGESLDDLAARAREAVDDIIMPHIRSAVRAGQKDIHMAVVSHGLCISELVCALVMKDVSGRHPGDRYRGLLNTAWTRVAVGVKDTRGGEPLELPSDHLPPLEVRVTEFNRHEHLNSVARQKGGIGSAAHDPSQQDIRAFFGGGATAKQTENEEGRSESNARDEVDVTIEEGK
ncbi:phosphoglycerate mutase-like protein [Amylocystis lapponica]|nr:phosphoglycerate mutase-like protein [Amylocystis lapponica]